jgi:hypothetical protein
MRRARFGLAAVAGVLALLSITTFAHDGHPQKRLLPFTWYQQPNGDYTSWMTLSTSDIILECDNDCASRWETPFTGAVDDWNRQPTTVFLAYQDGVQDLDFDVNVIVQDAVLGNPSLFGLARFFDVNYDECFFSCEVWYAWAMAGDDSHTGGWGTPQQRQATISHELGHLLGLGHESTNPSEGELYPCGYDNTGPIPHSIMSYNCIDPADERAGLEQHEVAPWDACGVNHKYNDPNWGFGGCEGLTTAVPPTKRADLDCDNDIDSVDALRDLRFVAGLDPGIPGGCPPPGVFALQRSGFAGDIDCDNDADALDALRVLRFVAALPLGLETWCPAPDASTSR